MAFVRFLHYLKRRPTFAMSLHSYGRSVLHPFSCKSLAPTLNASSLLSFQRATERILRSISEDYTTGQAWKVPGLYTVSGDAVDYLWHNEGIPAINVELPPSYPQRSDYDGFWPDFWYEEECVQLVLNGLELARCELAGVETDIQVGWREEW